MRLRIDAGSAQGNPIYYHGSSDAALANFLRSFLRPGMTYVDAGANLGEFVVRAARRVGPRGRVYALEAAPGTFANLQYNIALNRLRQVRPMCVAVADSDAPQQFYPGPGPDSGSSSLYPSDGAGPAVTVPGLTLDTLAEREGLQSVDLIKLDVEGAELAAFRGMTKLLSRRPSPVVVFEFHPEIAHRQGWSLDALRSFLRPLGYQIRWLRDSKPVQDADCRATPASHPTLIASR